MQYTSTSSSDSLEIKLITKKYDDNCEMVICTKCGNHGGLHQKSALVKCSITELELHCECGHAFKLVIENSKGRLFLGVMEFQS